MDNSTTPSPTTPDNDDTAQIIYGAVLGPILFALAMALFIFCLRKLEQREDQKYAVQQDLSKIIVEKPIFFSNPAADMKEDDGSEEIMVTDVKTGEMTTVRSGSQRSANRGHLASISDHDVVVGSMKDLKEAPEWGSVITEEVPEAKESSDDGEVACGIQRGGPRGATVAIVHMEPSEFEEAVRLARKPSPSVKVRPTYSDATEDQAFEFGYGSALEPLPTTQPTARVTEAAGEVSPPAAGADVAPSSTPTGSEDQVEPLSPSSPPSPVAPKGERQMSITPSLTLTLCTSTWQEDDAAFQEADASKNTIIYPLNQPPPPRPVTPKPNRKLRPSSMTSNGSYSSSGSPRIGSPIGSPTSP